MLTKNFLTGHPHSQKKIEKNFFILYECTIKYLSSDFKMTIEKSEDPRMLRFESYLAHAGLNKQQYQYDGVKWCLENETRPNPLYNVRGGFLADEMGLGKTITMIGLCLTNFVRRTLIVVPIALVSQWADQIRKTTGHKPLIYYGKDSKKITLQDIIKAPIVITTYSSIIVSIKNIKKKMNLSSSDELTSIPVEYLCLLHRIKWNRIIFDEAHHLRNIKTERWVSAKMLVTEIRWLVSGTPVQNNIKDLYNLLNFLGFPGSSYKRKMDNIKNILQNYLLKRTKKQVGINIPDVNIIDKYVDWKNINEKKMSEELHAWFSFSMVSSSKFGVLGRSVDCVLSALIKAKQSCLFPKMLEKNVIPIISKNKETCSWYGDAVKSSSKIDYIVDLINSRKDNGNGKILFCNFKTEIDEFYKRLTDLQMSVVIFDGRVSFNKRMELLKSKCNVLIMQIQTGCEGLNLQENYSEIYFTSYHWNPYVEEQAIARCHRIGQKKEVFVFRFIMTSVINDSDLDNDSDCDSPSVNVPLTIENYVSMKQDTKKSVVGGLMFGEEVL